jgi:hypothetical protein
MASSTCKRRHRPRKHSKESAFEMHAQSHGVQVAWSPSGSLPRGQRNIQGAGVCRCLPARGTRLDIRRGRRSPPKRYSRVLHPRATGSGPYHAYPRQPPMAQVRRRIPLAIRRPNGSWHLERDSKSSGRATSQSTPALWQHQGSSQLNHYIPFGCPVYVLDSTLQSKLPFHKWKQQWRVGIYLGRSPLHSKNVALVLDRNTALVSPQFHVKCDHNFHTAKEDDFDSNWQVKAGFSIRPNKTPTESTGRKRLLGLEGSQQLSPGQKKR